MIDDLELHWSTIFGLGGWATALLIGGGLVLFKMRKMRSLRNHNGDAKK
jgi:hypothetical protein